MLDTFEEYMGKNDEARAIAGAFLKAGIRGLIPATVFRQVPGKPGHYIAAKPDLLDVHGTWFEFKTYAFRDYAVAQCKVFSWVVGYPVVLVTWDGTAVKKTRVDGRDITIPAIPGDWFSIRDDLGGD
jgi:hypothetical protein